MTLPSPVAFLHIWITFAPPGPISPIKYLDIFVEGIIRVQRPFLPSLAVPPSFSSCGVSQNSFLKILAGFVGYNAAGLEYT